MHAEVTERRAERTRRLRGGILKVLAAARFSRTSKQSSGSARPPPLARAPSTVCSPAKQRAAAASPDGGGKRRGARAEAEAEGRDDPMALYAKVYQSPGPAAMSA